MTTGRNSAEFDAGKNWPLTRGARKRQVFTAAASFILLLLFLSDASTHRWLLSHHNHWLDQIFHLTKLFGRTAFALGLSAILYAIGSFKSKEKWQRTGGLIASSVIVSGLIVLIAKPLFGRIENLGVPLRKPTVAASHSWHARLDERWGRFPSGDSAVAFATAGAIAMEFPEATTALPILAALTAIGRVYGNIHLASDVFAGGCLGWLTAQWLGHRKRNRSASSSSANFP